MESASLLFFLILITSWLIFFFYCGTKFFTNTAVISRLTLVRTNL